jgi:predicted nucleic acid-binding protein
MDRVVLDTSVLIKSLFRPLKSLSTEIYARELATHEKCRALVKLLEERDVEAYVPRACVIEMAAVAKRLADKGTAKKVSKRVREAYEVVDESLLFDTALMIATNTGSSGFDSYFISLTKVKNALLLTDDNGMHLHSKEVGVNSVLIREKDLLEIEASLGPLP